MRQILNALKNLFTARSRGRNSLLQRLLYTKGVGLSLAAFHSRRSGAQAILVVGILATCYAGYLYVASVWSPGSPKPSHDVILKSRFSSPIPAKNIVILDVDERSLAAMSELHGRWPWPRDVLADGLQKLSDLQVRSVLFNVMLSDPDKSNPDADAAMDLTAMIMRPIAFPLIRLNPANDTDSRLLVAQIPGVELAPQHVQGSTLAAILPLFGSMHDRLGIANQQPDADGIVRQYPLLWKEATYTLPSTVQRMIELAGGSVAQLPATLALNWRNKQGRYQRVSFSDLLLGPLSADDSAVFKDAYVVLSVSAPGLGQTKATSVAPVEDDGEILATALDDALNDTYLRTLPDTLALVINLVTIWSLVWLSNRKPVSGVINQAFFVLQSGLGGITLLSASYTHYLIDLSDSMSFGLAVFAAVKLVCSLDDRWSRARPGFRKASRAQVRGQVLVLSFRGGDLSPPDAAHLQQGLEAVVGLPNVLRVDDLFGGESFLKAHCAQLKSLLVLVQAAQVDSLQALLADARYRLVRQKLYDLVADWDPEDPAFAREAALLVLSNSLLLLTDAENGAVADDSADSDTGEDDLLDTIA